MEEHFFYHSFLRNTEKDDSKSLNQGCQILSSIRDIGLLLVPQIVDWRRQSRRFQVIQNRVCFTRLKPKELLQHSEKFGCFSLEFDTNTLRSLGAVPAFYIPECVDSNVDDGSLLGTLLLEAAIDAVT